MRQNILYIAQETEFNTLMYITAISFALLALKWAVHGLHTGTCRISVVFPVTVPAVTYLTGSCSLGMPVLIPHPQGGFGII